MISKVTEQHLMEASKEPVYKVVRAEADGKLKSLWVRGTEESPIMIDLPHLTAYALTYEPSRVISDGRYGIWCSRTLEAAISQAKGNGYGELCKIYRAYPIGEPITPPACWGHPETVLYPAVIMGSRCIKVIDHRRRIVNGYCIEPEQGD